MRRFDPYDADRPLMLKCGCGRDHTTAQHEAESAASSEKSFSRGFIETTLVKALLPSEPLRRRFLQAVGATTARAAIASLLPISALEAMAQDKGSLEKKDLKIGFIAITCATPLMMADPLGFYKKEGLNVQLNKTAGWALIRDKMLNEEHDASHFLAPMPLAISMGLGSVAQPMRVATVQNPSPRRTRPTSFSSTRTVLHERRSPPAAATLHAQDRAGQAAESRRRLEQPRPGALRRGLHGRFGVAQPQRVFQRSRGDPRFP
jgi:hypothetical protein